jgi:hypothetical protein
MERPQHARRLIGGLTFAAWVYSIYQTCGILSYFPPDGISVVGWTVLIGGPIGLGWLTYVCWSKSRRIGSGGLAVAMTIGVGGAIATSPLINGGSHVDRLQIGVLLAGVWTLNALLGMRALTTLRRWRHDANADD